ARGVLGTRIRLVSFSVDPGRDTPDVLQRYSEKFGGSPPSEWVFLTGSPPEQIQHLIEQGFHLAAQRLPPDTAGGTGGYEVMHSPRLLLVDRRGRVRGVYVATEDEGLRQLHTDLDSVLEAED
ncbi:MAG: SCO family protein, partial [Gemmatimonadales bacterium]